MSATPSTSTPAPGATYTVTIDLSGLTSSGDTGYWITNGAGTPAISVYAGNTGTNQTTYTRSMTAPVTPGAYTYTVWCERGNLDTGQAKSTTYSITVEAPPAPTAAITTLTPNHGLTGASVVIAGTDLGTGGTVRFGATTASTRRLERDIGHRHGACEPRPRRLRRDRDAHGRLGFERAQLHRGHAAEQR